MHLFDHFIWFNQVIDFQIQDLKIQPVMLTDYDEIVDWIRKYEFKKLITNASHTET
tara:strand:- start:2175 stop:2342 length:168 start_codon:yes stop_codon:yes gene_type:complete